VQVLHPPQKFECPPFWNGSKYGIKKYGVEVIFNGMTSLLNFMKIYQLVQMLLGGYTDRRTDRQTGDLISLTFLFKESRLKSDKYFKHVEKFKYLGMMRYHTPLKKLGASFLTRHLADLGVKVAV
jgi:hypothetical protein